jgi:hypothetical protein
MLTLVRTFFWLGHRILANGSFARTGLPGSITSANYDAANELTNWNGTSISYDLNGNMLSDGMNIFTWNARDQVATLNAPAYNMMRLEEELWMPRADRICMIAPTPCRSLVVQR